VRRVWEKKPADNSEEVTATIYANLKSLGVNVDAVRTFSLTAQQLKQFHDGILLAVKRRRQNNLACTTC